MHTTGTPTPAPSRPERYPLPGLTWVERTNPDGTTSCFWLAPGASLLARASVGARASVLMPVPDFRHTAPPGHRDLARLGADLLARRGLAGLAADLDVIAHALTEAADRFQGDAALILARIDTGAIEQAASSLRAADDRAFDPCTPWRFDADSREAL